MLLQIWKNAKNFSADKGSATSWLSTLARRRAIDFFVDDKYFYDQPKEDQDNQVLAIIEALHQTYKNCKISAEKILSILEPEDVEYRRVNHPTQKPLMLMERIITIFSNPNDLVLDCFAGSGSTLVAVKSLSRQYIGVEREKNYFDICVERLKD